MARMSAASCTTPQMLIEWGKPLGCRLISSSCSATLAKRNLGDAGSRPDLRAWAYAHAQIGCAGSSIREKTATEAAVYSSDRRLIRRPLEANAGARLICASDTRCCAFPAPCSLCRSGDTTASGEPMQGARSTPLPYVAEWQRRALSGTEYQFSAAKKSLPLSSTTMKAGKSSTSMRQMASMPSSWYSITSTFLMQSCASRAAGPPIEPR